MEQYNFIKEEDFREMTKTQKLEMPNFYNIIEISKLLFIPIKRKMDGYGMGAFFIYTKQGWAKLCEYEGDFEYGGVVIFGFINTSVEISVGFGGAIRIRKR